ncbi:MAG TPA: hypothetical protein VIM75_01535 [Ohtaekwangia sp.]|uniref:hypothetical protein n=1 Tax=Ohtaekwangia sp. TaxID=2066019 RepID=UPI002F9264EA
MYFTKKFILFSITFLIIFSLQAQTVTVKKESARIKNENTDGNEVLLDGIVSDVNSSLIKFLKTYGKVKQSEGTIILSELTLNGKAYTTPVYALVKDKGQQSVAWLGIRSSEWSAEDVVKINTELEKILHEFGVKFYRDKIQVQIDETARAIQAVEKQQQRLINEGKTLTTKLEDNKREKIQLEKSLENNKLQNALLLKRIEKNKHDQDSITIAADQIKKVTVMHKEKQQKVN